MKTPTQAEIDAEIKLLESYKTRLPKGTFTDNHAALNAQIRTLQEKLNTDDIYDCWPDDEADMDVRCSALDAHDWLHGENGKPRPSDEWKTLIS